MKYLEDLGYTFGVRLDESEHVELENIDRALLEENAFQPGYPQFVLEVNTRELWEQRQNTMDAYRLLREANAAYEIALVSNGAQKEWNKAYCLAYASDDAVISLLMNRVSNQLMAKGCALLLFEFPLVWGAVVYSRVNNPYDEDFSQFFPIMVLIVSTALISAVIPAFYSKQITSMLVPHSVDKVLNAALAVGIELDTDVLNKIPFLNLTARLAGKIVVDSDSLIGKLVNIVNNAEQLKDIKDLSVPDELCCPFTREVMTDPVYYELDPNSQRFERAAILSWLETKNVHPFKYCSFFPEQLKRDFKLKLQADQFVENQLGV